MELLLEELSSLDVKPLQVIHNTPELEQERGLDTLTTQSDIGVSMLLTARGTLPVNSCCCDFCCCCGGCC